MKRTYKIDIDKISTFDDLKLILKGLDLEYTPKSDEDYEEIKHLLKQDEDIIWAPYIPLEKDVSDDWYDNFMKKYNADRKCCPKCGATGHSTTLVGYILVKGKEDEYKDKNGCVCSECGDSHIFHDRVPKKE